jgi:hypothetical protein
MSNGGRCCAARVCCPLIKAKEAVAKMVRGWLGDDRAGGDIHSESEYIADKLLTDWDLAPVGTADAVVENWNNSDRELGAAVRAKYASLFLDFHG